MSLTAYDTFTDTAGTSLASHTPNVGTSIVANGAFGSSAGTITAAGRARGNATIVSVFYYSSTPGSADYDVSADLFVASNAGTVGITGREATGVQTQYLFDYEAASGTFNLYTQVAGSQLNITTVTVSLTVGSTHRMMLRMRGTTISCYVDGVRIISITDSNISAAGHAGILLIPGPTSTDSIGYHLDNFTADLPAATVVTDSHLFFSPGNWDSDGSGTIQANNILPSSTYGRTANPGAYVKTALTAGANGYANLQLDTTVMSGVTAANCPSVAVSVDGGALVTTLLVTGSGTSILPLATGLAAGAHTIQLWFQGTVLTSTSSAGDRWTNLTTDASCVKVLGVELDSGSSIASPTLRSKRMIVFGDSITEGADANAAGNVAGAQDATLSYPNLLAVAFDCEVGIVGWSAQGYEQVGYGNVPVLASAYNLYCSGRTRQFIAYDYIVDNHGTNGTTVASDVSTMIGNYRAAVSGATILMTQTFGQFAASAKATGVTNYLAANPTETKVFLIEPAKSYLSGLNSNDGIHPNGLRGHPTYAAALIELSEAAILTTTQLGTIFSLVNTNLNATITSRLATGSVDIGSVLGHAATVDANNALNTSVKYVGGTLQTAGDTNALIATAQTGINNINNLSALATIAGPTALEIPASGSIAYPFTVLIKDAEGHLLDLSGSPTVTAANAAGTDRSANVSAVTHAATGQYTFTYTVLSSAVQEGISIKAAGTASSDSTSRVAYLSVSAVAVDTVTMLTAVKAKTDLIATNGGDSPAAKTAQTSIATNLDDSVSDVLTQAQGANIEASTASAAAQAAVTAATAIKAVTDKVGTMLVTSGGNYTFTVDAVKNAPSSGVVTRNVTITPRNITID